MKSKHIILIIALAVTALIGIVFFINGSCQSRILLTAVETSNYDMANRAISKGAWVNKRKYLLNLAEIIPTNPTPLISACKSGDEKMVELLLRHGADVNKTDNFTGKTPLLAALHGRKSNRFAIAMYLIENGADIHCSQSTTSPLEESVVVLSTDDSNTISAGYQFFLYLIENHVEIKVCNRNENLLTYAVHYNNINVARYLIDNQYFDVNCIDPDGNTALIVACKNNREMVVAELLKYEVDISIKNTEGKTALDYAKENNNAVILSLLKID